MKKFFYLLTFVLLGFLVACGSTAKNQSITLDTNKSFAFATYMSSELLATQINSVAMQNNIRFMEIDEPLLIETDLDEVNVYFDKLKAFMDNGTDILTITETTDQPNNEYEITYSIENVTYTIYYRFLLPDEEGTNASEELNEENEFQIEGHITINDVTYNLIGANEMDGEEQKMWFKTIDTSNSENFVNVEIKKENNEQKFKLTSTIDGVVSQTEIKLSIEENETKIDLKLISGEAYSSYIFKKETENGETIYKLKYQIGEVQGEVRITERVENGETTYIYTVKEKGKQKVIEKRAPETVSDTGEAV